MSIQHQQYLNNALMGLNVLVEGPGGTGKTFSTRRIVEEMGDDNIWVVCPTGKAAVQIADVVPGEYVLKARTIHSQFGIAPYNIDGLSESQRTMVVMKSAQRSKITKFPKVLIIDEISMVGKTLLEIMDQILKKVKQTSEPMGGVQVIAIGDMFQLQPVKDDMPYHSHVWKSIGFHKISYTENKRYNNDDHFDLMNRIRIGITTDEDLELLNTRHVAYKNNDFTYTPILLSPRNDVVRRENERRLNEITHTPYTFLATDTVEYHIKGIGSETSSRGYADPRDKARMNMAKKQYQNETKSVLNEILEKEVILKQGCRIMFRKNLNPDENIMNGTMGTIMKIGNVETNGTVIMDASKPINPNGDGLIVEVKPDRSMKSIFLRKEEFSQKTWNYTATRKQIPIVCGYALTVHKSQGSTMDSAVIDTTQKFYPAQFYVAISRVRTLEGLYFTSRVAKKHIIVDERAVEYFI